ncbi:hypothetical protein HZS_1145 [Henneguya salminicola]|nr:hypothetical protein HZS_1145 [Henneguya salminicola]
MIKIASSKISLMWLKIRKDRFCIFDNRLRHLLSRKRCIWMIVGKMQNLHQKTPSERYLKNYNQVELFLSYRQTRL